MACLSGPPVSKPLSRHLERFKIWRGCARYYAVAALVLRVILAVAVLSVADGPANVCATAPQMYNDLWRRGTAPNMAVITRMIYHYGVARQIDSEFSSVTRDEG